MGGFHGGHSSGGGGGFHGGHSGGGSFHSHSRGPRYHTTIIHTGGYTSSYNQYGRKNSKKSFISSFLGGLIAIVVGIILFIAIATPKTTYATITRTNTVGSRYDMYEVYDFEYEYNGKTYYGSGDDDLNSDGSYNINVGETYTLYLHVYSNASYEFENQTKGAIIVSAIFILIGGFFVINTVLLYKKYKKRLAEVGDANGDGVVNEEDIEYAEKKNSGKADGVYDGARAATADNTYDEMRKDPRKVCPYCGSFADVNDSFCQNCGGKLNN